MGRKEKVVWGPHFPGEEESSAFSKSRGEKKKKSGLDCGREGRRGAKRDK